MKKGMLKFIPKKMEKTMHEYGSEIFLGVGVAGMITTTIMAVSATPKAIQIMNERRVAEHRDDFSKKEVVKSTWKCYIPSGIIGALSVTCLVMAGTQSARRSAALATACTISETALKDYQSKVIETISENKHNEIRDAINSEKAMETKCTDESIIKTGRGDTICLDPLSGRYFYHDVESIREAVNSINERLLDEMELPLNDLYYELGLSETTLGGRCGWDVDKGLIRMRFTSALTQSNRPCVVMDYDVTTPFW